MDPFTMMAIAGIGMQIFGGVGKAMGSSSTAALERQKAGLSAQNAGYESQQNDLRRQTMEMSNRRSQLETFRTMQRQRAMATQAGVTQGAQNGTGLQGGLAEVTSQGNYGLEGLQQQLSLGRQNFDLDNKISANKMQIASLGGQEASIAGQTAIYGGISDVGSAMTKSSSTIGNIFQPGQIGIFNPNNYGAGPKWT